jgi:chloramphenicol 3-O phosphotransferase
LTSVQKRLFQSRKRASKETVMTHANPRGKIILLNGASSSGKSTLARALQATIDEPFWHISIDHLRDAGVLPLNRIRSGEFDWKSMREAFFEGFHLSLPAYASAGNSLIVEHIIETQGWMARLVQLLMPYDVFFVAVHCNLTELERREALRGDRPRGSAHRDFETIHRYARYDLEIDGTDSCDLNVERLIAAWRARPSASTFQSMATAAHPTQ